MGVRLEVIQFFDETNRSLIQRVPAEGTADIKLGAQLIVYENQEAIFFRDGKALDRFGPGRYTLSTANVPLLTRLFTLPWEKSPFQCSVYFVGKQTFLDQKWGTRQPIVYRDPQFGMIRLRSFGKYSFRVSDAAVLINTLVGTQGKYTTEEVTSFLKDLIVARLTDFLGTLNLSVLDLPARYDEVAAGTRAKASTEFAKYGLEIVDFFINAITPPEEVQKMIDARSGMGAVGDLNAFLKYQIAQSLGKIGESGGEAAGAMGMGYGAGFGMMLPQMIREAMREAQVASPPSGTEARPSSSPSASRPSVLPSQPMPPPPPSPGFSSIPGRADDVEPPVTPPPLSEASPAMPPPSPTADSPATVPPPLPGAASPADTMQMVQDVATRAGYKVEQVGGRLKILVPVGDLRKQVIWCEVASPEQGGGGVMRLWSVCGPASEKNAAMLLRENAKLSIGAFAFQKIQGQEFIVIQNSMPVEQMSPLDVARILPALAWQADRVEERLSRQDVF